MTRSRATGAHPEIAWLDQPGRQPSRMLSFSDGFRGDGSVASLVAVAECRGSRSMAERVVAFLRDSFTSGVAFGVGDALADAACEARQVSGECSFAAAASLGGDVWVVSRGGCRAFVTDGSTDILLEQSAGETPAVRHLSLSPGQSVVLVSEGLRRLIGSAAASRYTTGKGHPLDTRLRAMVDETRIRFRASGGSIAAVRLAPPARKIVAFPKGWRMPAAVGSTLIALVLVAGILGRCGDGGGNPDAEENGGVEPAEPVPVVMPLAPDTTGSDTVSPPPGEALHPVQVMGLGAAVAAPAEADVHPADREPDPRYENASRGVYYVQGDSTALPVAEALAGDTMEMRPVRTMITVRTDATAEFSDWLRSRDSTTASGIAVLVESSTSVAGGASWIRGYPLFVAGVPGREMEPSGFAGDSVPGIPCERDPDAYAVAVVP